MKLVDFMTSSTGRLVRVAAGLALIGAGVLVGGGAGWVLGVVGLVPLAAGVFNVCLLAPLFHAPLHGPAGHRG